MRRKEGNKEDTERKRKRRVVREAEKVRKKKKISENGRKGERSIDR
jgi:hypothetical protein